MIYIYCMYGYVIGMNVCNGVYVYMCVYQSDYKGDQEHNILVKRSKLC